MEHVAPVGVRYFLFLWVLFFLICAGLGYPTLRRYDPRHAAGLSDTSKYYAMTAGDDRPEFREVFRRRVLVPAMARPFYWFALRYLTNWSPGFFALLVVNSMFCAATACLIVSLGNRVIKDLTISLVGATLYLLSFAVPNLLLAGLVDAGEAFFIALLVWALLTERWYLLPVLGVGGVLAKETFLPFASAMALSWWLLQRRIDVGSDAKQRRRGLIFIAGMTVLGLATVMVVHYKLAGTFAWPWELAREVRSPRSFPLALLRCVTQSNFWYVFGWLIPLGVWRLSLFPKSWVGAAMTGSTVALLLGAYIDAGGSIGRSVFNVSGPLLSLSVALLIARPSRFSLKVTRTK